MSEEFRYLGQLGEMLSDINKEEMDRMEWIDTKRSAFKYLKYTLQLMAVLLVFWMVYKTYQSRCKPVPDEAPGPLRLFCGTLDYTTYTDAFDAFIKSLTEMYKGEETTPTATEEKKE